MSTIVPPPTSRGRAVYFLWNNLPRFVLLLLLTLIFVLFIMIGKKADTVAANKAAEVAPEKPPVNTVTLSITPGTITDRMNLPGAIEPWTRLELTSKLSGTITEVLVREGDMVKEGDVLAKIEADDYRIALDRAEAAYKLAQAEYDRDRAIYDKGVIATSAMEANRTNLKTAKADYENAQLMLSRTTVTSPMSGTISRLDAKVGLLLSVGDPMAEILQLDRVKAVVGIPESDVVAVRPLKTVEVTVQALNGRTINATSHFLAPRPDTIARLYNLELAMDNPSGDLLPGMFLRADIIKKEYQDSLAVPFYSIITRNNEQYVYVEEDGVAVKRPVSTGIMEQWRVQVVAGLTPGDKVIVEGHRDVEDGQKVKVVKAANSLEELTL